MTSTSSFKHTQSDGSFRGTGRQFAGSSVGLRQALTALVISLLVFAGCATEFPGEPAERDQFEYPVGLALHPNGQYLYVVNANFDLQYRSQDGGTLMVIDVETGEILVERTMRLASFASRIELNHDASRGYITVRGDSSVTWFSINEKGDVLDCPLDSGSGNLDQCQFDVPEEPTSLEYVRSSRSFELLDENGQPVLDEDGNPRQIEQSFDLLAVSHLRQGFVSVLTVGDASGAERPAFSIATGVLIDGPSDVTVQNGERFFVTGRVSNEVVAFRPAIGTDARVIGLFTDAVLPVPTPFSSYEGRSLLFSPDGDRLYVTNQSPNSLLIFDTSAGDNDAVSGRSNRIIGQIDMPRGSNEMEWVERPGESPLLYVTSFREDVVSVVDVEIPALVGEVIVGDGPFDIEIDQNRNRAYVTNFAEDSISVLDISDPLNPEEIDVIGSGDAE